jgi:hypothetical protein
MRTALNGMLGLIGILISVMAPSNKTVAIADATTETHNVAVIFGLHVALPEDMKTFPTGLVPLP